MTQVFPKRYPLSADFVLAEGDSRALIAVLDDDALVLEAVEVALGRDFALLTARTPDGFCDAVERVRPDGVVVDLGLGDVSGIDIIEELRSRDALDELPIVVLSGQKLEREAVRAGADAYVRKPTNPLELMAVFKKLFKVRHDRKYEYFDRDE